MGQKIGHLMLDENQEIKNLKNFFEINYSSYDFLTLLGNSSIQKTVLVQEKKTGIKFICKLYPKNLIIEEDYQKYKNKFLDLKKNLSEIKGIIPIDKIEEKENYGLIFREYLPYNYKDILIYFTSLTQSEKKLICLQLLLNLYNLHSKNIIHGDLKLSNILFTSKLNVFLSDVAIYKPINFNYTDISVYNTFFRNNNNIFEDFCYLSPNRIIINNEKKNDKILIEDDIFSLGIILAEIFLGEEGLFKIDDLINFKTKNIKFDLEKKIKKINDKKIENLLLTKMINLDSISNTEKIILEFIKKICPSPISSFFIHFNYLICYENYFENDLIIALIWRHFKQIWKIMFKNEKIPEIKHKPNLKTIEILFKLKTFYDFDNKKIPFHCVFIKNNKTNEDDSIDENKIKKYCENQNDDCSIIIIRLILSTFINMKFESNLLLAIELLENFSAKINDKNILFELIIPYLIYLFKNDEKLKIENNLVLISSFKLILKLLENINEQNENLELTFNGNSYFTYFISKKIFELFFNSNLFVKCEIIENLDKIINLQKKFLKMELINNKKEYEKKNNEKFTILETSNINNSVFLQESIFYFNNENNKNLDLNENKNEKNNIEKYILLFKEEEKEFKNQIDKIIESIFNCTSETEDEEILKGILIKKFPVILLFFGKKKNKYLNYLMMQFNRNNFLVQKEILKICPFLLIIFGKDFFKDYYSIFLEKIQKDKKNEVLVLEAIHSIFLISKLNLLNLEKILILFQQFIKYFKHPNFQIRNEMKKLFFFLIKKCKFEKKNNIIFSYLFKDIQKIHNNQFFIIDENLVENLSQKFIDRNNFNLFKNFSYDFNEEQKNILNLITKKKFN